MKIKYWLVSLFFYSLIGCGTGIGTTSSGPLRRVSVHTASELTTALSTAAAGDEITLADGTYSGNFSATVAGTESNRITITGTNNAIIDGASTSSGICFRITSSYVSLKGITLQNCKNAVVIDSSFNSEVYGTTIQNIGDEAIHIRSNSSSNIINDNTISNTGVATPGNGEGLVIGSSNDTWCTYSNCNPDASNSNYITSNRISSTTAECIDIREGANGTQVMGNTLDGNAIAGANSADSIVDIHGNGSSFTQNIFKKTATSSALDAIQVNVPLPGYGAQNNFSNNQLISPMSGYGIRLLTTALSSGNIIYCNNSFTMAVSGAYNTSCL